MTLPPQPPPQTPPRTVPGDRNPLPAPLRNRALLCVILGAMCGFSSVSEATAMARLSELKEQTREMTSLFDPEVNEKVALAQTAALEGMRMPRAFVLGALAIACALMFIAAARLMRPGGLPRSSVRALLVHSALAAAVLRTLDGAQMTVVVQRMGAAAVKAMANAEPLVNNPEQAAVASLFGPGIMIFSIGYTALMAGTFLLMSMYFRSEKVKQILAFVDKQSA
jgi:hypothetical protein